jgi:GntR family transcriptional regulator, transcriptional repressor for pyruvate dehydrogenase complex
MFSPISNQKTYEYVMQQIQRMILSGQLEKGDKLPSERELAEKMQISRTSIREGLRVLETMGVIESKHGEGNYICSNTASSIMDSFSMMFVLNNGKSMDILELRKYTELITADLAAQRGTQDDFYELEEILTKLRESDSESEQILLDKQLHYKIASMSGNYLIQNMYITSANLFEKFIEDTRKNILTCSENSNVLLNQHENIVNAIIEQDSVKAVEAMRIHLDFIEKSHKE